MWYRIHIRNSFIKKHKIKYPSLVRERERHFRNPKIQIFSKIRNFVILHKSHFQCSVNITSQWVSIGRSILGSKFLKFSKTKQKSRHIDSTNSGRTFHPLAQFALKLCNGLNFKHWLSVCYWPGIGLYFFGQIICVGIKPISKKYVFQVVFSCKANTLFTNLLL